jgi:hypothetical protein
LEDAIVAACAPVNQPSCPRKRGSTLICLCRLV